MKHHTHAHHNHSGCQHHHGESKPARSSEKTKKVRFMMIALAGALSAGFVVLWPMIKSYFVMALFWVQAQQKLFHESLSTDLRAVAETQSLAAILSIVALGFLYGIFHAAGPGHGKVIVTGYLLAGRHTLRRGIAVSGLSSLLQSITAIILVLGIYQILGLARQQAEDAAAWLEVVGYGLMALVGLGLLVRGVREAWHHKEGHHHHEGCNHGINPVAVASANDRRSLALMILSIGIRPCTGALLVLFFSCIIGVVWAGVWATLAMGLGTFITTATLAVLAVQSKKGLLSLMGASETLLSAIHAVLSIVAGGLIFVAAALFLLASVPDGSATALPKHPLLQRY